MRPLTRLWIRWRYNVPSSFKDERSVWTVDYRITSRWIATFSVEFPSKGGLCTSRTADSETPIPNYLRHILVSLKRICRLTTTQTGKSKTPLSYIGLLAYNFTVKMKKRSFMFWSAFWLPLMEPILIASSASILKSFPRWRTPNLHCTHPTTCGLG